MTNQQIAIWMILQPGLQLLKTWRNLGGWRLMGSTCQRRKKHVQSLVCQAGGEGIKLEIPERGTSIHPTPTTPLPAVDAQILETDHRSAQEHLTYSMKEFQPLQPVSQLHWGPSLNTSMHANACSMWNKQEELEPCAHLQGCNLIGIKETWWDGSYD